MCSFSLLRAKTTAISMEPHEPPELFSPHHTSGSGVGTSTSKSNSMGNHAVGTALTKTATWKQVTKEPETGRHTASTKRRRQDRERGNLRAPAAAFLVLGVKASTPSGSRILKISLQLLKMPLLSMNSCGL